MDNLAVGQPFVGEAPFAQGSEVVAVEDADVQGIAVPRAAVCPFKGHILVGVFHFLEGGVRGTVGANQSVADKVAVTGHVLAEITAVGPVTISVVFDPESLVYPVPDETALQVRILVDGFPLCVQVAV